MADETFFKDLEEGELAELAVLEELKALGWKGIKFKPVEYSDMVLFDLLIWDNHKTYSVEVKRDKKYIKTGNLFIESKCKNRENKGWHKSGINVTESNFWIQVTDEGNYVFNTYELKDMVMNRNEITTVANDVPTKGKLISKNEAITIVKPYPLPEL